MSEASHTLADRPVPGVVSLFITHAGVGVVGFGGVLPMLRHAVVEKHRWLTPAEFTDMLALCQFLPGGNALNLSVAIGMRFAGVAGAIACVTGMMAPPVIIVILMGTIYERYRDLKLVAGLFTGLGAGAAGLIAAVSLKIAMPLRGKPVGIGVALVCFAAVAWVRLPLLEVMLTMVPISVLLSWRFGE